MDFLNLPNEIILEIVVHLPLRDVHSLLRVSRPLYILLADYPLMFNIRYQEGSALLWAVLHGHMLMARRMIALGAKVNNQIRGTTFLHVAAMKKDIRMLKFLFTQGADPSARDNENRAPIYSAICRGDLDLIRDFCSMTPNLPDFIVDLNKTPTALHIACANGLPRVILEMIVRRVPVDRYDADNQRALDNAKAFLRMMGWRSSNKDNITTEVLLEYLGADKQEAYELALKCDGRLEPEPELARDHFQVGQPWSGTLLADRGSSNVSRSPSLPMLTTATFPFLENAEGGEYDNYLARSVMWSPLNVTRLFDNLLLKEEHGDESPIRPSSEAFPSLGCVETARCRDDQLISFWTNFKMQQPRSMPVNSERSGSRTKKKWRRLQI